MAETSSTEPTVRLYHQDKNGDWTDWQREYPLSDFAGQVPVAGDLFLEPGVLQGRDRYDPAERTLYRVEQRIFNSRDCTDYIILVVTEHKPTGRESLIVTNR